MKIKEKYFFETRSCKEISYSEVWENLNKECLEKIITVLSKSKSLNLNNQVTCDKDAPYPENLDDLEKLYLKYIEKIEAFYNKSEKYNCVTTVQEMRHFYCPGCGQAHRDYEYLKPMSSWDEIKKKYEEIITFSKLMNFFSLTYRGEKRFFDTFSTIVNIMFAPEKREDWDSRKGPFDPSFCLGYYVPPYEDKYIPFDEFQLAKNGMPLLCCPDCGEIIEIRESDRLFFTPKNLKYKYLTRCDNWFLHNSIPCSYEIFERDEKVILSIIYCHYFPNTQGKMAVKKLTNDRYIFNTKTGQSYKMKTIDIDTKKGVFDGANNNSTYKEPKINNITYSERFSFHVPEECIQATIDAICKKQNVPLILAKDIDEYHIKCYSKGTGRNKYEVSNVKIISYVNRYAKLGRDFIKLLYETYGICYISRKQLRKYFEMQTNPEVFIDLMKKNNVKTKGLKKIFAKNPLLIYNYNYLITIGFKNIDVIMSLLRSEKTKKWFKEIKTVKSANSLKTFVEEYSSIKTEAELAKKVLECDDSKYFFDMGNIYTTCLPILNVDPDLSVSRKKALFKGDIKRIHDTLSDLSYAISSRGFYIPYTKEEMKYNANCGEYTFSLAKTSIELRTAGRDMHICVGTYSNSALEKRTVIVLMRKTETNELAACIELSPDYKTMRQAKDYCNGRLSEEKLNPLVSYFKHFEIEYTSSRDGEYNNLGKIHSSESVISVDDITEYKIFDSKEEFKKIYCDEVFFNGEKVLIPQKNEDNIWDDDYYQLPF